ncbi:aldehyde dehydrogenase family protein [Malacoplasma penetrans]|uniref:Aldehyde dehydrogenase n=2 Tax=Malacoplasma penetrans TaxID=28227 RepID=Q8EVZ6_MALP2|nr:aldehyde dehydrogenase family protein [Malacoplasma penetrans]RXY97209.1 aldehyde dehydrogenase family protein [Malacoplasma penetrans]BAC44201.1 aldehyde dehydrogenase [Malacoplasma penetrans HF-2]
MNNLFSIFDLQKNFYMSSNEMSYKNLLSKLIHFNEVFKKYEKELYKVIGESYDQPLWDIYHTEIKPVIREVKYFIKRIKIFRKAKLLKNNFIDNLFKQNTTYRQPYGSCLFLLNQSMPISKTFILLIGALVCGNSLFVKLPTFTVDVNRIIKCIFKEVFNDNYIYFIDENISENDLKNVYDFNFDLVYYNGNTANAKTIQRIFAPRLTKIVLDINNKNPVILDETANLELAAKKIIWSKMLLGGQTSHSPDFLIIHESIFQSFIKILKTEYDSQFGKGEKIDKITRIDTNQNYENITSILNKSLSKNRIIFGGLTDNNQRKIELTLVQVDDLKSALLSQDINSPILPVVIFNSFSDINGIVEHSDTPSCIYFFSKNKKRINSLLKQIESRFFCINNISIPWFKGLPFGGIKNSGTHLYSKRDTVKAFTYKKIIIKEFWDSKEKYLNNTEKNNKIKEKIEKMN